jgi:hypothetical protein
VTMEESKTSCFIFSSRSPILFFLSISHHRFLTLLDQATRCITCSTPQLRKIGQLSWRHPQSNPARAQVQDRDDENQLLSFPDRDLGKEHCCNALVFPCPSLRGRQSPPNSMATR